METQTMPETVATIRHPALAGALKAATYFRSKSRKMPHWCDTNVSGDAGTAFIDVSMPGDASCRVSLPGAFDGVGGCALTPGAVDVAIREGAAAIAMEVDDAGTGYRARVGGAAFSAGATIDRTVADPPPRCAETVAFQWRYWSMAADAVVSAATDGAGRYRLDAVRIEPGDVAGEWRFVATDGRRIHAMTVAARGNAPAIQLPAWIVPAMRKAVETLARNVFRSTGAQLAETSVEVWSADGGATVGIRWQSSTAPDAVSIAIAATAADGSYPPWQDCLARKWTDNDDGVSVVEFDRGTLKSALKSAKAIIGKPAGNPVVALADSTLAARGDGGVFSATVGAMPAGLRRSLNRDFLAAAIDAVDSIDPKGKTVQFRFRPNPEDDRTSPMAGAVFILAGNGMDAVGLAAVLMPIAGY